MVNTNFKSSTKVVLFGLTPIWSLLDSILAVMAAVDCRTAIFMYRIQTSRVTRWQFAIMYPSSPKSCRRF